MPLNVTHGASNQLYFLLKYSLVDNFLPFFESMTL